MKLNSVGASTKPGFTPLVLGLEKLVIFAAILTLMKAWDNVDHLWRYSNAGIIFYSPGRDTVANAFVRSTKRT